MAPDRAAALLGVDVHAPAAEVQRAFLRAARRTHPDVLPASAGAAERSAASAAFDDLVRARAVLLQGAAPVGAMPVDEPPPTSTPMGRSRGIGGSLMVLALLAFLLVALVTLQQAMRPEPVQPGSTSVSTP